MTTIRSILLVDGAPSAPRKRKNKMTPTQDTNTVVAPKSNPVTRTVFDLTVFDSVKLEKPFTPPSKPTDLNAALAAVGNDTAKLLDVIHAGLTSEARDAAYNDIQGFLVVGEDGEATEPYVGKFADDAKGKLINNAILAFAKMNGYDKSLPKEKKAALKESATQFLRDNPAAIASIQG